jgi:hypothetical protein
MQSFATLFKKMDGGYLKQLSTMLVVYGLVGNLFVPYSSNKEAMNLASRMQERSIKSQLLAREEEASLERLGAAIARFENCEAWNNPGCLSFAKQRNAHPNQFGYAVFSSRQAGWEALLFDLRRKRQRGLSDRAIVEGWTATPNLAHAHRILAELERLSCH